jgi:hypothetical protein
MRNLKAKILAGVVGVCACASFSANALTLNYSGDNGVTATATFTFTQIDPNTIELNVVVSNTTAPQNPEGGPRLTAIALGFDPDLVTDSVTADLTGSVFTASDLNGVPGNSFGFAVDYCVFTNNCSGGPDGLFAGQTDAGFDLTFNFTANTTTAEFEALFGSAGFDSCVRFQTVGPDGQDSEKACTLDEGEPTPEPGTLALLGLGLLGLSLGRRRRAA